MRTAPVDESAEAAAIVSTVRDYFEGWFEGDAARMRRALHPGLAKRALTRDRDADALDTDTAQEMIDATEAGVGTRHPPKKRHFDVDIEDVYGTIANVTVRSDIYREYLSLVRTENGWKIVNALWQFVDNDG
ncbi:MAG: nuclear transport factor 2 family protein [Actinomycetota bacterium]